MTSPTRPVRLSPASTRAAESPAGPTNIPADKQPPQQSTGAAESPALPAWLRGPKVFFVGAGPGAPDLLTIRAAKVIASADVVVWAASLVSEQVLDQARADAEVIDSSRLTLEEILAVFRRTAEAGGIVARLHSGDPSVYGAIQEQIDFCDQEGIPWEIVPGVSALGAAAAALGRELTIPEIAQSVIVTRLGGRTPVPDRESLRSLASHRTTMALFLSAARPSAIQKELIEGGYSPETPCAVVFRASWPDERIIRCSLSDLGESMKRAGIRKTAVVLVGRALSASGHRSRLYDPGFGHGFRRRLKTNSAVGSQFSRESGSKRSDLRSDRAGAQA